MPEAGAVVIPTGREGTGLLKQTVPFYPIAL